jgi:hypothetical protein
MEEVALMIKRIVLMFTMALVMTLILAASAVSAQELVQVGPKAQAIAGGQTLLVRVTVACEPGLQVLEANVSATQGATSTLAGIGSVVCDGKSRVYKVRVNALDDARFSRGDAFVSAFVLLLDPLTQMTVQGQDARTVSVVGPR